MLGGKVPGVPEDEGVDDKGYEVGRDHRPRFSAGLEECKAEEEEDAWQSERHEGKQDVSFPLVKHVSAELGVDPRRDDRGEDVPAP